MTAVLHGVRRGDVTGDVALAWFAGEPGGTEVIGYFLAPDQAEWFRYADGRAVGPSGPRNLGNAFEIVATDGTRQLRWTHEAAGTGRAVSLAEDLELLPAEDPLPAEPARTRLAGTASRLLAGRVVESQGGWATLGSARYARCQVPVAAERAQEIWAELAEYTVTDEHGNLSVIDTVLVGLRSRPALRERHR